MILLIFIVIIKFNDKKFILNKDYLKVQKNINITFHNKIKDKLRIGIYCYCLRNGGRARITSLLINYLYTINIFKIYLLTLETKQEDEYKIPYKIKRFVIKKNLFKILNKNMIDILIYELDNIEEIEILNTLNSIKVIFFHHSSNFDWIYSNYSIYKSIYKKFKKSKYFISIVPIENDYLFEKWGIRSILMNNFITYEYNKVIPSDLTSKNILLIGRGNAKKKRFQFGIQAMEYISQEISECKLIIISDKKGIKNLFNLVINSNLYNIEFVGYNKNPELYYKNSSLNIFPSISEAFPMVIAETKIFGIPNIILGIDYLTIAKEGTFIIYDDTSESLANEAVKILKNRNYRSDLGKKARKSMKKFNNKILSMKWIKLILSIYNGDNYYQRLRHQNKKIPKKDALNIIHNQIILFKKRDEVFNNISIINYENFNFMENLK